MALTDTQIDNYLKSSYGTNIAGQLERITKAHEIIQTRAIDMALQVQNGEAGSTSTEDLSFGDNILKTASAINKINIKNYLGKSGETYISGDIGLDGGNSIVIPVGYNKTEFTVQANSVGSQLTATSATAGDILIGTTAYIVAENIPTLTEGSLANYNEDKDAKNPDSLTNESGFLKVKIPATGKYYNNHYLITDIPYINPSNDPIELPVTVRVDSTGEIFVEATESGSLHDFTRGYYTKNFSVRAILGQGSSDNKIVNIATSVPKLEAQSGNLSGISGYDYYSSTASYEIQEGALANITGPTNSGNKYTWVSTVKTEGWLPETAAKTLELNLVDINASAIASPSKEYTPAPTTSIYLTAGSYTGDGILIKPMSAGTPAVVETRIHSGTVPNGTIINASNKLVAKCVTAGYLATGDIVLDVIGVQTGNTGTNTTKGTAVHTALSKKTFYTNTSGAHEYRLGIEFDEIASGLVTNSSDFVTDIIYRDIPTANPIVSGKTVSCTISLQKGYYDGGVITLNESVNDGLVAVTGPTKNGETAFTKAGVTVAANSYYVDVVKTAGYITEGENIINLGTTIVSGNHTNSGDKHNFNFTASAGYNPEALNYTISVDTEAHSRTTDYIHKSVEGELVINGGTYVENTITVPKVYTGAASYELKYTDLAIDNSTITIEAEIDEDRNEKTFMSQLSVNMEVILNQLLSI